MNNFKKNIYKNNSDVGLPNLVFQSETNTLCYGAVSILVDTDIPVKVNMTATFDTGASYHMDTGYSYPDIINDFVFGPTIYKFGINASGNGIGSFMSSIDFTINDSVTDEVIDSYFFDRAHSDMPC